MLKKGKKLGLSKNILGKQKQVEQEKTYQGHNTHKGSENKIEMFDFFKLFFTDDDELWKTVPKSVKQKNGYMLFQYLSIEYPTVIFNFGGHTTSCAVIDALHDIFKKMDYPSWFYIDGKSKTKNFYTIEKQLNKYPKQLIDKIKEIHQMDRKDFEMFLDMFGQEFFGYLESENSTYEMNNITKIKK